MKTSFPRFYDLPLKRDPSPSVCPHATRPHVDPAHCARCIVSPYVERVAERRDDGVEPGDAEDRCTITTAADELGITLRAVRQLDRLLRPVRRQADREYSLAHVRRCYYHPLVVTARCETTTTSTAGGDSGTPALVGHTPPAVTSPTVEVAP